MLMVLKQHITKLKKTAKLQKKKHILLVSLKAPFFVKKGRPPQKNTLLKSLVLKGRKPQKKHHFLQKSNIKKRSYKLIIFYLLF